MTCEHGGRGAADFVRADFVRVATLATSSEKAWLRPLSRVVMILIVTLRLKLHNAWTKALTVRIQ